MIDKAMKDATNKVIEIAKVYGSGKPQVAINHGIEGACARQSRSFKNKVLAELRKRGYRI